jgi:hypothetical protein
VTLGQLPSISTNSVLGNNSGVTSVPSALTASNVLDMIGTTQGQVLYRGASGWAVLAPGTSGQVLTTAGAAANPSWATVSGTGTVTNIATSGGLTGGPITTTGTLSFASIATGNVLAYTGGGSGTPVATTPSAVLDVIGSTTGAILYRAAGGTGWQALAPGTNGQVLTQGASTPSWSNAGTVSNITLVGSGLTVNSGGCTITTSGTCTLTTTAATKSDQQTGSSNSVAVTPLHQQDHDSALKVLAMFTGSGSNGGQTVNFGFNVSGVSRVSIGVYAISFTTAFASTSYACTVSSNGSTSDGSGEFISQSTGSIRAVFKTFASGSLFDPVDGAYVMCGGRQ